MYRRLFSGMKMEMDGLNFEIEARGFNFQIEEKMDWRVFFSLENVVCTQAYTPLI